MKIIDVCKKVTSGGTPLRSEASFWENGKIPWLKTGEIRKSFIYETEEHITKQGLSSSSTKLIPKNSIIIAMYGDGNTAGKVAVNKIDLSTNQACCNLIIDKSKANYLFIYYLLKANYKNLINLKLGGSQQNLNATTIKNLDFPIPPPSIQKKISAILHAYDELIENNNRRIAILEKMAEEIYREWFVRMRFPGHEKVKVVKGVPEGWKLKRFRDLISYYIGGGWGNDYQNIEFYKPAYVIRGTDIPKLNNGIFKHEILRYHKTSNFKTRQLIKDDIVFEVSGGSKDQLLGRTLLITKDLLKFFNDNVICASFCKLIRPNQENVRPSFIKYFFKLYYDTGMVGTFQTQSTGISNYHFEDFLNFQTLNVPDITTQKKLENTIQSIIEEKDTLSLQNSTLKKSRDLLLPRLISGKLDVEKLDITFPPGMRSPDPAEGKEANAA